LLEEKLRAKANPDFKSLKHADSDSDYLFNIIFTKNLLQSLLSKVTPRYFTSMDHEIGWPPILILSDESF
jgi:hypothetical protein